MDHGEVAMNGARTLAPYPNCSGVAGPRHILATWRDRIRSRWKLAQLDPYLLKDIGLTRQQVEAEIAKPFWQR